MVFKARLASADRAFRLWGEGYLTRRRGDAEDTQGEPVRVPITDVFDLHSVPARDVQEVVEEYLSEARRMGFKALRIIHGRGIGVQREMVRAILARTDFVEVFGDAPGEAGGWGATVVTLK